MAKDAAGAPSSPPKSIAAKTKDLEVEVDKRTSSLLSSRTSISSSADSADSDSIQETRNEDIGYNVDAVEKLTPVASRMSTRTGISVATNGTTDPAYEVDFDEGDNANPREWKNLIKCLIIAAVSVGTTTVVMYSTAYSSGIPGMMKTFDIQDKTIVVLGLTTYLIGLALGSIILAPLSEMFGRRPIYIISLSLFTLMIIPCALSPTLEGVLIARFFGAIAGSAMLANAPGTIADLISEEHRALAFSIWSIGPMNGPVLGPLVGGFVFQALGWRWINWVVLILAAVATICLICVKETYTPAILRAKAAKLRKETGDDRWFSRYDDKLELIPLMKTNLKRPCVMAFTEPICIFWNLYVAVIYGILYLCFVAYPIIFGEMRGWSPGITGLGYMGLGIGGFVTICSEPLIRRMINAHKVDPATGRVAPEAMVSVIVIAAISIPVGELIFAWTCTPNVHWIAPIIAGIPFGAGNCAVFIYASNYMVYSYGIYAASALAGNAVLRSIMGGCLPLAGPSLYAKLSPHWAGTLLGLMEVALIPIPLVFWKYGHIIRKKSALISRMREDEERAAAKQRKAADRLERARRCEEKHGLVDDKGKPTAEATKEKELFEV